jgi:D-tagatose-1,6-bisphosphate aldolase subunit GatZ/KbaZ
MMDLRPDSPRGNMSTVLQEIFAGRGKSKTARGIYSVCSAHPWVIRAAVQQAVADKSPLLLEATSNQVNQDGGYTGMRPVDFRRMVLGIAAEEGLPAKRIILGGDHLGPGPWQRLKVAEAMASAKEMVADYRNAGFTKFHLDTSMACVNDDGPLSDEAIAERAAQLCEVAETTAGEEQPLYIIGTEVPAPGGAMHSLEGLKVTERSAAEETLRLHKEIFAAHGLAEAWPRVVGMVVQPGVEFNHDSVVDYASAKAADLKKMLKNKGTFIFEAHSTDYQKPAAYRELVADGFAILKVGPALTFAMREALFALSAIESELVEPTQQSRLWVVVNSAMLEAPKYWKPYYQGEPSQQRLLRKYSYSDRIRYYWNEPSVKAATEHLIANLGALSVPEPLLSAYLPDQYRAVREGSLENASVPIILHRIRQALAPYAAACFPR